MIHASPTFFIPLIDRVCSVCLVKLLGRCWQLEDGELMCDECFEAEQREVDTEDS